MTKDSILYGSTRIEYSIDFAPRKTLGIRVEPDGSVWLKAPENATLEEIRQKVHRKAPWILRQWRYFESFGIPTTERQYISGESLISNPSGFPRPSDSISVANRISIWDGSICFEYGNQIAMPFIIKTTFLKLNAETRKMPKRCCSNGIESEQRSNSPNTRNQ